MNDLQCTCLKCGNKFKPQEAFSSRMKEDESNEVLGNCGLLFVFIGAVLVITYLVCILKGEGFGNGWLGLGA